MRKWYLIFLIIGISFLIIHAFFGHLIFGFAYEQDINKHSTYIHLQEQWKSFPRNILFEVTTVWSNSNSDINDPYYEQGISVHLKTEYNPNELQSLNGKSYVELNHEFSDCKNRWKPIAYRHTIDTISHQFSNLIGTQINSDPYVIVYSPLENSEYGPSEQKTKVKSGFSQFIPICTSKDFTSYDYSVLINDENLGFDVYFVPTIEEKNNFHQNTDFNYYDGCFGQNYQRFSGTCENVSKDAGLLIIVPDELNFSLTKITVNLHEKLI